jgi:integrase
MGDIVRLVRGGRFIGWYVRFRDTDGRRKMRASHQPTKESARRYLLEIEARVARGIIGIPEPAPPAPMVSELFDRFLDEYSRPGIKHLHKYRQAARSSFAHLLPLIGTRPAEQLSRQEVERVRGILLRTIAPRTVGVVLAFLSVSYSWAVRAKILSGNPVRGVERPKADELLDYLTLDEARRLLTAAEARTVTLAGRLLRNALLLALHTGLRKGELLGLRWQDVDIGAGRLTVARSYATTPKGGKARHLRLPKFLSPMLSAWSAECPRTPSGLVFPVLSERQSGRPRMGRAQDMLGLPALLSDTGIRELLRPWHTLRHTFASHFVMAGGNILTLQKILGHTDIKLTLVYAHLAPDYLAQEMERVRF